MDPVYAVIREDKEKREAEDEVGPSVIFDFVIQSGITSYFA